MAIDIAITDETGNVVESLVDPTSDFHRIIPSRENSAFIYINRIDCYGDTTFNRLQVNDVRDEFIRLQENTLDPKLKAFIEQVILLANRVETGTHLFLKFIGD